MFAFFTSALGVAGEIEYAIRSLAPQSQASVLLSFPRGLMRAANDLELSFASIVSFFGSRPAAVFAVVVTILVVVSVYALSFFIINVSHAALLSSVKDIIARKKVQLTQQLQKGLDRFWSVFGVNAIAKTTTAVSLAVLGWAFVNSPSELYWVLFLLLTLFVLPFLFVLRLAVCGTVMENWGVVEAIKNGWNLFKHNMLLCFEIGVMIFLFYGFYFIVLLQFTVSFFTFSPALKFFSTHASPAAAALLSFIIPTVLYAIVLTPFIVFNWAVWVFVFEAINRKESLLSSRVILAIKKTIGK